MATIKFHYFIIKKNYTKSFSCCKVKIKQMKNKNNIKNYFKSSIYLGAFIAIIKRTLLVLGWFYLKNSNNVYFEI